jgi:ankyrin repeat protein
LLLVADGLWTVRLGIVRALFKEIRAGDLDAVTRRLDADPALVSAVAKAPPKKDDGQSPLQVAIKSGNFIVAQLLLDRGADVNFMEESAINQWNAPVLHDSIRSAVFSSRYGRNRALPGQPPRIEVMNDLATFEEALAVLRGLIERGADVTATDSYGNSPLLRAALDARQIIDEPISQELLSDVRRVFSMLLVAGADPDRIDPRVNASLSEHFAGTTVERFLTR